MGVKINLSPLTASLQRLNPKMFATMPGIKSTPESTSGPPSSPSHRSVPDHDHTWPPKQTTHKGRGSGGLKRLCPFSNSHRGQRSHAKVVPRSQPRRYSGTAHRPCSSCLGWVGSMGAWLRLHPLVRLKGPYVKQGALCLSGPPTKEHAAWDNVPNTANSKTRCPSVTLLGALVT